MVYLFLAEGFEIVEALAPVDILRRGKVQLVTVGVGSKTVKSSCGVEVTADITLDEMVLNDSVEAVILPGGMPGTLNLEKNSEVIEAVKYCFERNILIGAICAAPSILGHLGMLSGKKATCYPGFEKALAEAGATYTGDLVTVDGNVTTAEGPAAAFPYAYELLTQLVDKQTSDQIAEGMRFKHLMA